MGNDKASRYQGSAGWTHKRADSRIQRMRHSCPVVWRQARLTIVRIEAGRNPRRDYDIESRGSGGLGDPGSVVLEGLRGGSAPASAVFVSNFNGVIYFLLLLRLGTLLIQAVQSLALSGLKID